MKYVCAVFVFVTWLLPLCTNAALRITEVQYDRVGSDDGYEWIEIQNVGSVDADASALSLLEGGVRHRVKAVGQGIISPGTFAVIADAPESFRAEYPSFVGVLLDSSFSLSNTGETLSLYYADVLEHQLFYSSSMGGGGDGHTLNVFNESLFPRKPTPGAEASFETVTPPSKRTSGATQASKVGVTPEAPINDAKPSLRESSVYTLDDAQSDKPWLWALLFGVAVLCVSTALFLHKTNGQRDVTIVDLGSDFD